MSSNSRGKPLEEIVSEVLSCTKCRLWKQRNRAVPGGGNPRATVMFVGEAPGRSEDLVGLPFVGAAGKILNELLRSAGVSREEVYITNVVKCRPPKNRDPRPDEISTCTELYLSRQVQTLRPRVLVLLGRHAASHVLTRAGLQARNITQIHGIVHEIAPYGFSVAVIPMLHPAAALRNSRYRALLEKDFLESKHLFGAT
ncbi:MAG: uracil-DNA glycosylase [Candidatus Bathyarchaeota archaeon]|nr:uracil-DNA glycosylase [Candidatus Bathyarchaeota archaeon]